MRRWRWRWGPCEIERGRRREVEWENMMGHGLEVSEMDVIVNVMKKSISERLGLA